MVDFGKSSFIKYICGCTCIHYDFNFNVIHMNRYCGCLCCGIVLPRYSLSLLLDCSGSSVSPDVHGTFPSAASVDPFAESVDTVALVDYSVSSVWRDRPWHSDWVFRSDYKCALVLGMDHLYVATRVHNASMCSLLVLMVLLASSSVLCESDSVAREIPGIDSSPFL